MLWLAYALNTPCGEFARFKKYNGSFFIAYFKSNKTKLKIKLSNHLFQ